MKELTQTNVTLKSGNCLQTCVAMLLDLPMNVVPNFNEGDKKTIWRLEAWLQEHGMALLSATPDSFKGTLGVYGIAAVKSQRHPVGVHAVIFRMDRKGGIQFYWDPDPDTKRKSRFRVLEDAIRLYVILPRLEYYPVFSTAHVIPDIGEECKKCHAVLAINCSIEGCPYRKPVDPFEDL